MITATVTKTSPLVRFGEIVSSNVDYATYPTSLPLVGFQRKLFNSVSPKSVAMARKSHQANSLHVFLHGISVGEIRAINGSWGWRRRYTDRLYATPEAAAIAYVKWAILEAWDGLAPRFAEVAC